jgi:hypothetical protein
VFNATFQQYFSYFKATSFSGGRSRCTWREPPTMGKQLVSFITQLLVTLFASSILFFFKSEQMMKCIYNAIVTPAVTDRLKNIEKLKGRTKSYHSILSINFKSYLGINLIMVNRIHFDNNKKVIQI